MEKRMDQVVGSRNKLSSPIRVCYHPQQGKILITWKDNIGKLCEDFLEKEDPIYEDIVNIVEAVESEPVIIGARGATLHR